MHRSCIVLMVALWLSGAGGGLLAGTSEVGSMYPDRDTDGDGLVNLDEAPVGTDPNEPDTDGDELVDGSEAVPTNRTMQVPAAPEMRYAVLDLGEAEEVRGVNDSGQVLFVRVAEEGDSEEGFLWDGTAVRRIGYGLAGSFAGPMSDGYVVFQDVEESLSQEETETGTYQVRSRMRRLYHAVTIPAPIAYGVAWERGDWSGTWTSDPPPCGTFDSFLSEGWSHVWGAVFDIIASQLEGDHFGEPSWIRVSWDSGLGSVNGMLDQVVKTDWAIHANYVQPDGGGEVNADFSVAQRGWKSVSSSYSAATWYADSDASRLQANVVSDVRVNTRLDAVADTQTGPVIYRPQAGAQDLPIEGHSSVGSLGEVDADEGPYFFAWSPANGYALVAWNRGNPESVLTRAHGTDGNYIGQTISSRLVVAAGNGLWRNGRWLPARRLGIDSSKNFSPPSLQFISPTTHFVTGIRIPNNDEEGPHPELLALKPHAVLLLPADIAVDSNRDGVIKFTGNQYSESLRGTAFDRTEESKPLCFWVNNDDDKGFQGAEQVPVANPDNNDSTIGSVRDLEDLSRLWVHLGALHEQIRQGTIKVGLRWRHSTGSPGVNVYLSADPSGSTSYLTDPAAGQVQFGSAYRSAIASVVGDEEAVLPASVFADLSELHPNLCFLFEGISEGKGELVVTLRRSDEHNEDTPGANGPGVWLDLKDIKKMYQRSTGNRMEESPSGESDTAIIFVHGWNMSPEGSTNYAETFFKRLWHRGFTGRFAYYRWNNHSISAVDAISLATEQYFANYNESEYEAWTDGADGLKYFIENEIPGEYSLNIAAHSMGNIVAGGALKKGLRVKNYAMMQAAVPAACYDGSAEIEQVSAVLHPVQLSLWGHAVPVAWIEAWNAPSPDNDADPATRARSYRGFLESISQNANLINFCLPNDNATAYAWEINNAVTKPPGSLQGPFRYDPDGAPDRKLYRDFGGGVVEYAWLNRYESMAFAAKTWAKAAGAELRTAGAVRILDTVDLNHPIFHISGQQVSDGFGDAHSAQFDADIQELTPFYATLLSKLNIFSTE